jgi:hypothetical protein
LSRDEFERRQRRKTDQRALVRPKRGWRPRWWTTGNSKLGARVGNLNLVAGKGELGTCPGATGWCDKHCYAKGGWYVRKALRQKRENNVRALRANGGLERFVREMNEDLKRYRLPFFRLHGSGDFWSREYCAAWREIALANPHIRFLAYSHSWRIHEWYEAIKELLLDLPNFVVLASTDPDTEGREAPPLGWRVAAAGPTSIKGLPCPYYAKDRFGRQVQPNCLRCGYCWKPVPPTSATFGNVLFPINDNRPNGRRRTSEANLPAVAALAPT